MGSLIRVNKTNFKNMVNEFDQQDDMNTGSDDGMKNPSEDDEDEENAAVPADDTEEDNNDGDVM